MCGARCPNMKNLVFDQFKNNMLKNVINEIGENLNNGSWGKTMPRGEKREARRLQGENEMQKF